MRLTTGSKDNGWNRRCGLVVVSAAFMAASCGLGQTAATPAATPPPVTPPALSADLHPIAIVPLDAAITGAASSVTGDMQVFNGRAFITANASVTAGTDTTHVTLPYRGELRVCSQSTVKLTADSIAHSGDGPSLLFAIDHGSIEMSFATIHNSDTLLTPDFRIVVSGPGAADLKVRLGPKGDTCVDNAGAAAPYVVVSSVFEGGAYRVQPGQRVMFQHGSLREVVDQEKESCGCPPPEPKGNEFPVAQSEHLALNPKPVPSLPVESAGSTEPIAPLIYKSADHVPQAAAPDAGSSADSKEEKASAPIKPVKEKKPGFFAHVGHFFKYLFGAD